LAKAYHYFYPERFLVSRLQALLEQTSFLLEKQTEAKNETDAIFTDLLAFIKDKINEGSPDSEQVTSLEKVYDMISGHAQKLAEETQDDVEFLGEQLNALEEINKIEDPAKADEVLQLYNGTKNNSDYIGKYASDGDFKSLVFYNSTSTYWNTTM